MEELLEKMKDSEDSIKMYFNDLNRACSILQLSDHNNQTISEAQQISKNINNWLTTMQYYTSNAKNLMSECDKLAFDIQNDLSVLPVDNYVYHTTDGMLSYPGREIYNKKPLINLELLKKIDKYAGKNEKPVNEKSEKRKNIVIEPFNYNIKLTNYQNITQAPESLFYYTGAENKEGIYIKLLNGVSVKVPFPEIIDSKREFDRKHSIRCKYINKEECNLQRSKMAKIHSSLVRNCNFAHTNDPIIKIGYPARCPTIPQYGNPETIKTDIEKVTLSDIKNILLYGINDIICASIWLDKNNIKDICIDNLEIG